MRPRIENVDGIQEVAGKCQVCEDLSKESCNESLRRAKSCLFPIVLPIVVPWPWPK